MIKSFKHKGLEKFFTTGSMAGIQVTHAAKIRDRLAFLHSAVTIEDVNIPVIEEHHHEFISAWDRHFPD